MAGLIVLKLYRYVRCTRLLSSSPSESSCLVKQNLANLSSTFLALQNINNRSMKYQQTFTKSSPVKGCNIFTKNLHYFFKVLYLFVKEYMVLSCLALLLCGRLFIPINSIMPPLLIELVILSFDGKPLLQFPVIFKYFLEKEANN